MIEAILQYSNNGQDTLDFSGSTHFDQASGKLGVYRLGQILTDEELRQIIIKIVDLNERVSISKQSSVGGQVSQIMDPKSFEENWDINIVLLDKIGSEEKVIQEFVNL